MLFTNQVPTTGMKMNYVKGEFQELIQEIKILNFKGISDEACDVISCFICVISENIGIPLPIFWTKSAYGWIARAKWIESWLNSQGLPYAVWMMKFGGNYKKEHKREFMRWMARFESRVA
jgi:hypothetical protein